MSNDDRPGRDIASRAAFHRVMNAAIALLDVLGDLPSGARASGSVPPHRMLTD